MRLAKAVAAEAQDHVPDLVDRFQRNPALQRPAVELLPVVLQLFLFVLFRKHLAQLVRLGSAESRQLDGHPRHILLVDHDAVGLAHHLLQHRVKRPVRPAFQPPDVLADVGVGGRANDGAVNDQVLEIPFAGFLLQEPHGRRLHVEDAHCVAARHQVLGDGIFEGIPACVVDANAVVLLDGVEGVPDHRQRPVAKQVDFHQPGVFGLVFFPLDDSNALGRHFHGDVGIHTTRHDDHAARVHGKIPWETVDAVGESQDLRPGGTQVHAAENGMVRNEVTDAVRIPVAGNALADAVDFTLRQAVDLRNFAHGRLGFEGDVVADHGRAVLAVAAENVGQNVVAFVPGEVHVDVRRIFAAAVQKALEKQVVADGIHVGDAEAVRHHAGRGGTPATRARRLLHDVVHHQEVRRVTLVADDGQLVLQALPHSRGDRAVPPPCALVAELAQVLVGVLAVGPAKLTENETSEIELEAASLGDFLRVGNGVRCVGEGCGHACGGTEVGVGRSHLGRGQAVERGVQIDGPQQAVHAVVRRRRKVHPVCGHRSESVLASKTEEPAAIGPGAKLGVDGVRAKFACPPCQQRRLVREDDQVLRVCREGLSKAKVGIQVAKREETRQIAVAALAFAQQDGAFRVRANFGADQGYQVVLSG